MVDNGRDDSNDRDAGSGPAAASAASAASAGPDATSGIGASNGESGSANYTGDRGATESGSGAQSSGLSDDTSEYVTVTRRDGSTFQRRRRRDSRSGGSTRGDRGNAAAERAATESAGTPGAPVSGLDGPAPRRTRSASADNKPLDVATSTKDLLKDALEFGYWIPAKLTGLPQWELANVESELLATRIIAVVKLLPKQRGKQVLNSLEKIMPGLSLIVAAAMVTVPRIQLTREVKKRGVNIGNVERQPAERPRPAAPTVPATPSDAGNVSGDNAGDTAASLRPVTGADFATLSE